METGVLFVLLAALALRMAAKQFGYLSKRLRKHPGDPAALLQASCGLGLLANIILTPKALIHQISNQMHTW